MSSTLADIACFISVIITYFTFIISYQNIGQSHSHGYDTKIPFSGVRNLVCQLFLIQTLACAKLVGDVSPDNS